MGTATGAWTLTWTRRIRGWKYRLRCWDKEHRHRLSWAAKQGGMERKSDASRNQARRTLHDSNPRVINRIFTTFWGAVARKHDERGKG